jgi:hypothetical protein
VEVASIDAVLGRLRLHARILPAGCAQRSADVLAFFDRPNTSNGPTQAING